MNSRLALGIIVVAWLLGFPDLTLAAPAKTGFLVIAPDRGFLGNQEIRAMADQFKKEYPAALGLVGREYTGIEGEYAAYLTRAVQELKRAGVTDIVAIPLFLSEADPVLKRAVAALPAYAAGLSLRWAPPMVEDFLIRQVTLDRVEALSQQPWPVASGNNGHPERLILIGIGATDEGSEQALKADVAKLLAYVQRYKRFREAEVVIYYDRDAEGAEKKNQEIKAHILAQIAMQGRTLVVPAFIGPKFDHAMALTAWLAKQYKGLNVAYQRAELLPHPNVLLWLKKTANRFVAASPAEIGVVIMPHGATQPWNDAVERVIEPLKGKHKIEMAYGMGDPQIIQDAVTRLEQQGSKRIVFARMYALENHVKATTDYILGLAENPPDQGHDHHAVPPAQIRSAALFSSFGGYEEDPAIADILHERIMEISKDPSKENVILLAHGEKTEEGNARWLAVMNANIEKLKRDPHCAKLKTIRAATLREDWPELREKSLAEIRKLIQEESKTGRVLVIANRLYGSGPYKKVLNGLEFTMNEKGFAHPLLTRWLERRIEQAIMAMTESTVPVAAAGHSP
jgi:sirohydrochlorin ferrochelatase